jgi:hypothetical protein
MIQTLDPKKVGYLNYRGLVREIEGITQIVFMHKGVTKLADIAV